MENLRNYVFQELNPKEMSKINGGFIFLLYFVYVALTKDENGSEDEGGWFGGGGFGGGGASGGW